MANLRKVVTGKVLDTLQKLANDDPEKYAKFWTKFRQISQTRRFVRDERTRSPVSSAALPHLEQSNRLDLTGWLYRGDEGRTECNLFYVLGDDEHSVIYSPHLDVVRKLGFDVLDSC